MLAILIILVWEEPNHSMLLKLIQQWILPMYLAHRCTKGNFATRGHEGFLKGMWTHLCQFVKSYQTEPKKFKWSGATFDPPHHNKPFLTFCSLLFNETGHTQLVLFPQVSVRFNRPQTPNDTKFTKTDKNTLFHHPSHPHFNDCDHSHCSLTWPSQGLWLKLRSQWLNHIFETHKQQTSKPWGSRCPFQDTVCCTGLVSRSAVHWTSTSSSVTPYFSRTGPVEKSLVHQKLSHPSSPVVDTHKATHPSWCQKPSHMNSVESPSWPGRIGEELAGCTGVFHILQTEPVANF